MSQVSLRSVVAVKLSPPNIITCACPESYDIAWTACAGGIVAGEYWIQLVPFHSQVSFRELEPFQPQDRTACPNNESYAIASTDRGPGLVLDDF
jgi:hypothetical protein